MLHAFLQPTGSTSSVLPSSLRPTADIRPFAERTTRPLSIRMQLETFYQTQRQKLVGVLTQYSRDGETAADAVQEAFVAALKNRELLSGFSEKSLWAWLYATAKNKLIDEKRKAARNSLYGGDEEEADPAGDFTDAVAVRELLYKLPPNLMQVVSLRYFGGLNATEIGQLKGIPPATVRSQLRSAITMLKKLV